MAHQESRTVTDYLLMVDYVGALTGEPGTERRPLGVVTEEAALAAARAALDEDCIVWRVEIFAREIPIDWTKVEELLREQAFPAENAVSGDYGGGGNRTRVTLPAETPLSSENVSSDAGVLRDLLAERDGNRCFYCGVGHKPLAVDHVVARSRGGSDDAGNRVLACYPCNLGKGAQPAWLFLLLRAVGGSIADWYRRSPERQAEAETSAAAWASGEWLDDLIRRTAALARHRRTA